MLCGGVATLDNFSLGGLALVDLPGYEELTALPPPDKTAEANPHVIIGELQDI